MKAKAKRPRAKGSRAARAQRNLATLPDILAALARLRPRADETLLQNAIEEELDNTGLFWRREHALDRQNRIDFIVVLSDGKMIGIEAKTTGQASLVKRQIYRYADHLDEIILVTTKALGDMKSETITNSKGDRCTLHVLELWKNPT